MLYYNLKGTRSYMQSVVNRNVVMQRMTLYGIDLQGVKEPTETFIKNIRPLVLNPRSGCIMQ